MPAPDSDRFLDGRGYEDAAGYARAARRGRWFAVSGTTAEDVEGRAMYVATPSCAI